MTLLGFRGVHPLALLFLPAALAAVFGGFWLLRRHRAALGAPALRIWLAAWIASALGAACFFPLVRAAHAKYLLIYYLCVLACFAALTLGLALKISLGRAAASHLPARRRLLAGGLLACAGAACTKALAETSAGEAVVEERRIRLERHPEAHRGRELRLSMVTDLHAGFFLPQAHLAQALRHVEAFAPDAVLFGGDLVEYELEHLAETEHFLRELARVAPVFAVLGNHDIYVDGGRVARFLSVCGARVLRGESVPLAGPWGRFTLAGLRDAYEPERSWRCLEGQDPATTLMLAHNPQMALAAPEGLAPWLTLSGHTHGGQLRLPVIGAAINQADRRIGPGLGTVDGRRMVVSAGLGYAGLPVRLACPPDVTHVVIA
ncbi:3',5'-cyclic adenosine monophosphate phosphodiesterase CpdA [Fundidesulfovibrio magnetotacticus]|uniref:3',5'-cyclic adenosine monophosphate phosphodiesterase CpdA n=1 Tax=Fundidesulfovibrio magnetotacticus TaxID=2730080 RepID=A0A6V8LZP0_9BACT|nr:metallophosphoesterase [Fundidesulfovibrio magnetotacticus]GFK95688.1 3',5'-cyclic adenosine monophosphate phosphodiesterase CpdA [Fundidesulfovibrio magnetotacticus]